MLAIEVARQKGERQLKKLLRSMQDMKYTTAEFKPNGFEPGVSKVYIHSDWAPRPESHRERRLQDPCTFSRTARCSVVIVRGGAVRRMRGFEGGD